MMRLLVNRKDGMRTALRIIGGPIVRLVLILCFLVLGGYLAYQYAYTPLFADVELPDVVQARNARIDTKALDAISQGAQERVRHIFHTYDQFDTFFGVVVDE